jgi:UDP-N-acetylmuramoyl-L-alanyl-D-glutamate--2,6-diaminopimelate ligase
MIWRELYDVLRERGLTMAGFGADEDGAAAPVTGVSHDSRTVQPGHVFVAVKGVHADGTRFAQQAIDRGAIAVVSEAAAPPGLAGSWVTVTASRYALALLADAFFGHPSGELQVVGITGTNGKTTTAYLLASIFEAARIRCGILGTVAYKIGSELIEATRTTPEAPAVQSLLREMVAAGCGACVMEVSSHALSLRRVDGTSFAAGVFTNLTRDHLDFHADMEEYFRAKRRLFEMLPAGATAIINVDDPRGRGLAESLPKALTYSAARKADVTTGPLTFTLEGLAFEIRSPRGAIAIRSPLIGRPNVANILAAAATAVALDLPLDAIEHGVAALEGVPGRFQRVSASDDEVTVIVDYAHTDDALRSALETARPLASGRVIAVFGCGGDRDRTKRPLMGAVAGRLSDLIVVTSDNPRTEDPARIIDEVCRGLAAELRKNNQQQRLLTIPDRREAIDRAIALARPGDFVLIAGKGHEKYQVIGDRVLPFDDVAVAQEALSRRRSRSGVA